MKVTMISSFPPQKGISAYTVDLLDGLSAIDCGVDVEAVGFGSLYPRFAYPGGSPEARTSGGREVANVRWALRWWDPGSWLRTGLDVRGEVVHAQWWSWFLAPAYLATLAAAKRRGKSVVVTAHNVRSHEDAGWKQALNSAVIKRADHIIVHAERNRRTLERQGIFRDRVSVVPHGALTLRGKGTLSREEARRRLQLPSSARIVLLPGNLRPYKGVGVLLEAATQLRLEVENLHVVIAGELWDGCPDPRQQVNALGLAGWVDVRLGFLSDEELAIMLTAADVVALPYTQFEAQSGAATLALSAGRALVVSDTGGLSELVTDPRAVVPPGDPIALAHALGRIVLSETLRTKLEADSYAMSRALSWECVAARTVDVYRHVLGLNTSLREAA